MSPAWLDYARAMFDAEALPRLLGGPDGRRARVVASLLKRALRDRGDAAVESVAFRNGALLLFLFEEVWKVPLARSCTARREPLAWSIAADCGLADLVLRGRAERHGPLLLLRYPRGSDARDADGAVRAFLDAARGGARLGALEEADVPEIEIGRRAVVRRLGARAAAYLDARLAAVSSGGGTPLLRIGPMHGDLHARNVIAFAGKDRVIDCGQLRAHGLPALDAIHAEVMRRAPSGAWVWELAVERARAADALSRAAVELYALFRIAECVTSAPRSLARVIDVAYSAAAAGV